MGSTVKGQGDNIGFMMATRDEYKVVMLLLLPMVVMIMIMLMMMMCYMVNRSRHCVWFSLSLTFSILMHTNPSSAVPLLNTSPWFTHRVETMSVLKLFTSIFLASVI